MKVVILGGGKVGEAICADLSSELNDIILIDKDERIVDQMLAKFDITGLVGDGVRADVLAEADIAHTDVFVAASDKDEVNIIAAILAKSHGAKHTVARVRNPEYAEQGHVLRESLGISMLINPERAAAREMVRSIKFPAALSAETVANNKANLVELQVKEGGPLADLSLRDFRTRYGAIIVCAIVRGDTTIVPTGENTLRAGDRIFVTGKVKDVAKFYRQTGLRRKQLKSLFIIGSSRITYYLLQDIRHLKIDTTVFELNREKCENLSAEFPEVRVIHGDGTDQELLVEHGLSQQDALIALTNIDEENLFTSIFAEKFNVCKIMTKMSRTAILKLVPQSPVRSIITPKRLAAGEIVRFVRGIANAQGSNVEALHRIADDTVEVLQFRVKRGSLVCDQPLSQLHLKKNILIAYIIRDGEVIIPTGQDELYPHDRVLVVTHGKGLDDLDDILEEWV